MDDREPKWLPTVGDWIYWRQHKDGNEWDGRGQKNLFCWDLVGMLSFHVFSDLKFANIFG